MPQATREIKRRIKSVGNTKKITKAMEMVSAAKMRKAVAKVLASRSYADLAWQTVLHLVEKVDTTQHPFFLKNKKVKKVAVILISTNRGLCGSFNTQILQKVIESINLHHPENQVTDIISYGTKGRDEVRKQKLNLIADFVKEDITQNSLNIRPIAHMITKDFMNKKYDKVFIAFTDYMTALRQVPHVKQLLPIATDIDDRLGHITHEKEDDINKIDVNSFADFVFEPNTKEILNAFLPRLIELQIYQAVLESEASEHSARMMAMRNATDAAEEMADDLILAYNQARQAGITAEIAEISAGSAALE